MRLLFYLLVLLVAMPMRSDAQVRASDPETPLDRLTRLLQDPPEALPVRCRREVIRFDRISVKEGMLRLHKNIRLKGSEEQFHFEIPLAKLSVENYQIIRNPCFTELLLTTEGEERAFTVRRSKYLDGGVSEQEQYRTDEISLKIYNDTYRELLDLLKELRDGLTQ